MAPPGGQENSLEVQLVSHNLYHYAPGSDILITITLLFICLYNSNTINCVSTENDVICIGSFKIIDELCYMFGTIFSTSSHT